MYLLSSIASAIVIFASLCYYAEVNTLATEEKQQLFDTGNEYRGSKPDVKPSDWLDYLAQRPLSESEIVEIVHGLISDQYCPVNQENLKDPANVIVGWLVCDVVDRLKGEGLTEEEVNRKLSPFVVISEMKKGAEFAYGVRFVRIEDWNRCVEILREVLSRSK